MSVNQVKDCEDYGCHGTQFLYPLVELAMNREAYDDLILEHLGIRWRKSCCRFCPFQKRATAIAHYQSDPQSAVFALWCEFNALAMNNRIRLFERYSVRDVCLEAGLDDAIAEFEQRCAESSWAVYQVRRIYRHVGNPAKPRVDAARKVETVETAVAAGQAVGADDEWRLDRFTRTLRRNVRLRLEQTFQRLRQDAKFAYVLLCEASVYRCAVPENWWLSHLEYWDCDPDMALGALDALRDRFLVEEAICLGQGFANASGDYMLRQHALIRSVSLEHLQRLDQIS